MNASFTFPSTRLRRNRSAVWKRRLVTETILTVDNLVYPVFLREEGIPKEIPSMPGIFRWSLEDVLTPLQEVVDVGIPAIILFPILRDDQKSEDAQEAYNPHNLVNRALRRIKGAYPSLGVMADVALDPYTSHGQDGLLQGQCILNDATLEVLGRQALSLAQAGADMVAPSDMMDGRIGSIRQQLDHGGYDGCGILAYAAKYASAFYGPFREAVCSQKFLGTGDKKTYQMSPANSNEALREASLDIQEGADMIMVKPGLPYLDVLYRIKETFKIPTCVYHVSGEYAMIKAAAQNGWLEYEACILETLLAFRRAGADAILSYAALDVAHFLNARGGYFNGA